MPARLKAMLEDPATPAGRAFALSIQVLILVSLVTFAVETLPGLSAAARRALRMIEIITVVIFSLEYVARVIVADRKLAFMTSFFGIIDLLAVLPFYISTGFDLRSIRVVRLMRLFRILAHQDSVWVAPTPFG